MSSIVYFNGDFVDEQNASIPISDRGFLFGDGVFTTIRIEQGEILNGEQHLERLRNHCNSLNIEPPDLSLKDLKDVVLKNNAQNGIWRMKVIITGGSGSELFLPKRKSGIILITIKPYVPSDKPVTLCVYPYPIVTASAYIKSLSYLERLRVKQYAIDQGCDDAIVTDFFKHVLETSFSNIFWIVEDVIYTPANNNQFLRGIALQNLLKSKKMDIKEGLFGIEDIPKMAKIFICNSLSGAITVSSIAS